jgi:Zn-dependent peptidase ImmA (M78 family)
MSYPVYAAEKVLADLGINTVEDLRLLEEIAWMRGVLVKEAPLASAEARLTVCRNKAVITVSSNIQNPQRKRFGIAHELGHFEIHRLGSALSVCIREDIDDTAVETTGKKLEQEANEFASAFLLPEQLFKPLCYQEDPSLECIGHLAELFNTSLTATGRRYVEFSDEPVALVYSENRHIKWVQQSAELKGIRVFINSRRKLDSTSVAAASSNGRKRVLASAWFDEGQFDRDAQIVEHSWHMPGYNAVLTLLWADEEITEDEDDW